jgi:hypothetical protein
VDAQLAPRLTLVARLRNVDLEGHASGIAPRRIRPGAGTPASFGTNPGG